jgi:hypothetical protein
MNPYSSPVPAPTSSKMALSKKCRCHRRLLGAVLTVLFVIAGLTTLLGLASFFEAGRNDWSLRLILFSLAMLIPSAIFIWGCRLMFLLADGFTKPARRHLKAFYLLLLVVFSLPLIGPVSHGDGPDFTLLSFPATLLALGILSIPVFATLLSKPEPTRSATGSDEIGSS